MLLDWGIIHKPIEFSSLSSLKSTTLGSCGLGISCLEDLTIILAYKLRYGITGPITAGTLWTILGRNSLTLKGIAIYLKIIDSDHIMEIIVFVSVATVRTFKKGKIIVQILLLSYVVSGKSECIRKGSIEITNPEASANAFIPFMAKTKDKTLMIILKIQGREFEGIFVSGPKYL